MRGTVVSRRGARGSPWGVAGLRILVYGVITAGLSACHGEDTAPSATDAAGPATDAAIPTLDASVDGASPRDATTSAEGASDATLDGGQAVDASLDGAISASDADSDAATDGSPFAANCASGTVGPAGGSILHPSGASIVVPPGVLAAATPLAICPEPSAPALGLGPAFNFEPEGQSFALPVQVAVPFAATQVPAGVDLSHVQVHMAPQGQTTFVALQSSVNLAAGVVRASTTHFTQFVAAQSVSPVFITTAPTLPIATAGVPYAQTFVATGGTPPYVWSVSSQTPVPPGLSFSSSGALTGTPTTAGYDSFFVVVSDAMGSSVELAVSLTVDAPSSPAPTLTVVRPPTARQGDGDTVIALTGSNFVPASSVLWDGSALPTTYVSETQLAATIPAADLSNYGAHFISVSNPSPGGGVSGSSGFSVVPSMSNPVPSLGSVSPAAVPISSVAVQVTVNGSQFIPTSVGVIAGQDLPTSYVSPSQLVVQIPPTWLSAAQTLSMSVSNPPPGGGTSSYALLSVAATNPQPGLTTLSQTSARVGAAGFTLELTGTGFVQGAQAFFGTTALATTFESATTAAAQVPSSLLASPGAFPVLMVNPLPGGGSSAPIAFAVSWAADGGGCPMSGCGPWTTFQLNGSSGVGIANGVMYYSGYNPVTIASSPTAVSTLTPFASNTTVAQLSASGSGVCILDPQGAATCWGYGLPAPAGSFVQIRSGRDVSCAIDTSGNADCWGSNVFGGTSTPSGGLGTGSDAGALTSGQVLGGPYKQVTGGQDFGCALDLSGAAYCWGDDSLGEIGNGTTPPGGANPNANYAVLTPTLVSGGHTFKNISAVDFNVCAVATDGTGYCWGCDEGMGALGTGTASDSYVPAQVLMPSGVLLQDIENGIFSSCGLTTAGDVYCWGSNRFGALGLGTQDPNTADAGPHPTPVRVPGLPQIASISLGGNFSACAVSTTGSRYCWGFNDLGVFGDGTTNNQLSPELVP